MVRTDNLSKSFPLNKGGLLRRSGIDVAAVDRVSLEIRPGETFGVVGESGSGKTTLARLILGLERPTAGRIYYAGRDITRLSGEEMKKLRLKMQMIFQDPYSSLDPRHSILKLVAEPLKVHRLCRPAEIPDRVAQALELVDLPATAEFMDKMPDDLSGGQRQRIGIARALITGAEFIIGDEPVSMLDANVKAGIVALLGDLKRRGNLTYMFITHEIGLAYHICDRIAVMYLGRLVETGPGEELIKQPLHPYTRMLIAAIPPLLPDPDWARQVQESADAAGGKAPFPGPGAAGGRSPAPAPPAGRGSGAADRSAGWTGCRFLPRCLEAAEACRTAEPTMAEREAEHFVACHGHSTRRNRA